VEERGGKERRMISTGSSKNGRVKGIGDIERRKKGRSLEGKRERGGKKY
jgi:hypothetical protein